MVRSISSTASGLSLHDCCADSIASEKLPKWQAPTARAEQRPELSSIARRERERAFRADQHMGEIDLLWPGISASRL